MFDEQNAKSAQLMAGGAGQTAYLPPTTRQRLEGQKFVLETQLDKVNKALEALDAKPELEAFMETIKAAQL